ncbi:MAG: helix-turn-helix transcriptional regulator [Lachnospiraceae bacterium]
MDEDYSAVEFGKRLRKIRKKRKYTQEQIAEKLYITSESVSNFETGKTACAHEHVTKLCQILNVSADYLYFGVERELNEEKSTELDKIINRIKNCNDFDLNRINCMIQILLKQPAA